MKLGSSLFTSSLALAAVALSVVAFTPIARAVQTYNGLTAGADDLFLGFRSGQTSGNDVLVNLGSVSDLLAQAADALAAGQTSIYIGNISAALNNAYTSGTKVYWTVSGRSAVDGVTGLFTGYTGISWVSTTAHQTTAKNIPTSKNTGRASSVYSVGGSNFNPASTQNNAYFTGAVSQTDTGLDVVTFAYADQVNGNDWGYILRDRTLGSGFANGTTSGYNVTTGEANLTVNGEGYDLTTGLNIDLYAILPAVGGIAGATPATLLGWFTIDAAGDLSFFINPSQVPEPATYAALMGGLGLVVAVAVRRRRRARS